MLEIRLTFPRPNEDDEIEVNLDFDPCDYVHYKLHLRYLSKKLGDGDTRELCTDAYNLIADDLGLEDEYLLEIAQEDDGFLDYLKEEYEEEINDIIERKLEDEDDAESNARYLEDYWRNTRL